MSRTLWLIVNDTDVPQSFKWASVKTPAEEPDTDLKAYNAALSDAEVTAGWDAHNTSWTRVPQIARPGLMDDVAANPSLTGRILTVGGVDFDLDDTGRISPTGYTMCPDGTLTTIADTVALAESAGRDFDVMEKTTDKCVRVWSTQDPADAHPGSANSGIYRQSSDSQVVRADEA